MQPSHRDRTPLDVTTKRIIELLQRDGRLAYSTIAREVGLSEGAVRQRVTRLIESGTLQIVGVTDPTELGFTRQAMIGMTVAGDPARVAAVLQDVDEVAYVLITSGRYDLLAEVVCEDDAHLLDVIASVIRGIDGVRETETFMYLRLAKQRYDWGTR